MEQRSGRTRRVLFLAALFVCSYFVRGEDRKRVFVRADDEDELDESIIGMKNDPSDFNGSERARSGKASQVIRLGFAPGSQCPHSCFCEAEDSYASCIGDGQWNPPLLPSSLSRLEMRSFYLPELESSSVRLPGLQELQLQQCNVSRLHQDAFIVVTELDRLDLSQNRLERLGPNQLRGLSSLRHLDLSSNRLSSLRRPFIHLTSLEHLSLRNNKLQKLDADTFDGLNKVQYVNLDGNVIATVNVASFQHLGSLAHLILSNNPLANLARLNFFGSRLQYIDVSNIGIERVPQALTQFVRDLRLAKNKVREIHRGDLDSYPYLGLLVLDDNGLEILEEDALGRHEYLARLWLNGNKLKNIPQSLPISLKSLYIEENQITNLTDGDFSGLSNLEQIFMQRNQISTISKCAFNDLIRLKMLDLQANNITNLSVSHFEKLTKLESLDLSQNPLLVLNSETFKGLGYVRVLQISRVHTNISISETMFDPMKSLQILEMYGSPNLVEMVVNSSRLLHSLRGMKELNLMHNEIRTLRSDFFSFFPKLSLIKVSGNAWDCSVKDNILWLKNWMQSSPINFYRSFSVRCSTPPSLGFKPVLLLEEDDFNLPASTTSLPDSKPLPSRERISLTANPHLDNDIKLNFLSEDFQTGGVPRLHSVSSTAENNSSFSILTSSETVNSESINTSAPLVHFSKISTEFLVENSTATLDKGIFAPLEDKKLVNNPDYITTTARSTSVISSVHPQTEKTFPMDKTMVLPTVNRPTASTEKVFAENISGTDFPDIVSLATNNNRTKASPIPNSQHSANQSKNTTMPAVSFKRDIWLYRGEAPHGYVEHRRGVSFHSLKKEDNAVIVGAGIVSACIGIALVVGGFVLFRSISRKHRRLNAWENSRSSYWNGREDEEGEFISEGVVVGIGETGTGVVRETEGTVEVVTESHHGLNNRLYLLLQRDSSTGITPETLPDPTVSSAPSIISSQDLCSDSRLFV